MMVKAPKGSRFTHPDNYIGDRTRGRAMGTLWWSETAGEGDVTLRLAVDDEMSTTELHDMLIDALGMLERELKVLVLANPGLAILPDAERAREILREAIGAKRGKKVGA